MDTNGQKFATDRMSTRRFAGRFAGRGVVVGVLAAATLVVGLAVPATGATPPNLVAAVHFLSTTTSANGGTATGTSLTKNGYYESFPKFADFGLTMDGAFALAATGSDNATLQKVVDFIGAQKPDGSGNTINTYTGIGTASANGGAIAKEAVFAQITGNFPHAFEGHDLIAALAGTVCTTTDVTNGCAAPGNYRFATSTFAQALGVIAQLRARDSAHATTAIAYLESLQNTAGAWPSLLPSTGDSDIDSTAMAAMALALLPADATASAAVTKAETWIASQQAADGGFTATAGESTNSAGLAIQALTLAGATYSTQIANAVTFLDGQQNADGGFNVIAGGQQGSDVRATAQVVSGIVGTSFGRLTDVVHVTPRPTPPKRTPTTTAPRRTPTTTATKGVLAASKKPAAELANTGSETERTVALAITLLMLGLVAMALGIGQRRPRNL